MLIVHDFKFLCFKEAKRGNKIGRMIARMTHT